MCSHSSGRRSAQHASNPYHLKLLILTCNLKNECWSPEYSAARNTAFHRGHKVKTWKMKRESVNQGTCLNSNCWSDLSDKISYLPLKETALEG